MSETPIYMLYMFILNACLLCSFQTNTAHYRLLVAKPNISRKRAYMYIASSELNTNYYKEQGRLHNMRLIRSVLASVFNTVQNLLSETFAHFFFKSSVPLTNCWLLFSSGLRKLTLQSGTHFLWNSSQDSCLANLRKYTWGACKSLHELLSGLPMCR